MYEALSYWCMRPDAANFLCAVCVAGGVRRDSKAAAGAGIRVGASAAAVDRAPAWQEGPRTAILLASSYCYMLVSVKDGMVRFCPLTAVYLVSSYCCV